MLLKLDFLCWLNAARPLKYWPFAFQTTTCWINQLPKGSFVSFYPHESLYHCKPNYYVLRVFGCACYPFLRPTTSTDFNFDILSAFSWFTTPNIKYICFYLDNSCGRNYVSRHVVFGGFHFPFVVQNVSSPVSSTPSSLVQNLVMKLNSFTGST